MNMAAQRPKRNNSPINSKHQPLKATVPLSSLVRNPSPTRRRTSPSSPVLPPDKRNRLIRRSPDVQHSDHRPLLSPLGSKGKLGVCLVLIHLEFDFFFFFLENTGTYS